MPRRPIERAREDFPDWPERPCLEEWTVQEHPCPWYRFGRDCERPWSDLTHPADYVIMTLLYLALVLAFIVLCYYMFASRKKRCELQPTSIDGKLTPPKKVAKRYNRSLIRTMSQDALMLNADGSERFIWSSYNDYERAIIWNMCVCITQCIAYIDPNGFYKILSLPVRAASHGSIRVFVDLTLFQMAAGYRKALKPAGTPRDWGVVVGGIISAAIQTGTLTLENTQVPEAGRPACSHSGWNFARHFGATLFEFSVFLFTLRYALNVRSKLKKSKARDTRQGRSRLQAAVEQIIARTFILCAIISLVMGFNAFVGARQAGSKYICYEPACTFPLYFSTIFWAVLYVATTWFGVFFFGIGLPPPIKCYGSKPTISAICCCCPRPAWLAPDGQRFSDISSIEDSNTSDYSAEYTPHSFSLASTATTRPLFAQVWAYFFGTPDIDQTKTDTEEFIDGDGTNDAPQDKQPEDYDEEAFFRDSQESKDNDPRNDNLKKVQIVETPPHEVNESSQEYDEVAIDTSDHHDTSQF